MPRHAFCHACGRPYDDPRGYPRHCRHCGEMLWDNPIPVSVVLVPVRTEPGAEGLLVIRRGIAPGLGKLALAGGFVEAHETWQQAAAREVGEETGIVLEPATLTSAWYCSTEPRPNRILMFSTAPVVEATHLPPFEATEETSERGLIFGPQGLEELFAFPLHVEAARRWLADRGLRGPAAYAPL